MIMTTTGIMMMWAPEDVRGLRENRSPSHGSMKNPLALVQVVGGHSFATDYDCADPMVMPRTA